MANSQPYRIKTISQFHSLRGLPPPEHPLISVIDLGQIAHLPDSRPQSWITDFYTISVKRSLNLKYKYGQQEYDFDEGVMFFMAPNQVFGFESGEMPASSSGWLLLIHADFLWNTPLAKTIKQYEYFDYSVNEALFLSEKEEAILHGVIQNIQQEYHSNIDKFSQAIILSQIETLLNYSERFYHRQFITRKKANHQLLSRLDELLTDHFTNENLAAKGLPTVQTISETLNVSVGYLSRVLKVVTGQSTQQHIHDKVIEKAKEKLSTTTLSVSEIAYELGFEHPQSFNKLFKAKTNQTPLEFRQSFN